MQVLFGLLVQFVIMVIEATIVMILWNLTLIKLFNFPWIEFWQSFSLLIICNCLFKDTLSKVKGD